MDYRKFLSRSTAEVLPWLGGASVEAEDRRLRVEEQPAAVGWWRFEIEGRRARAIERAEPPDLGALPVARGHIAGTWLFGAGGAFDRVHLVPADEPPVLSPTVARRWHGGELLFEALDFEGDGEEQARRALENGTSLASVKGIQPSLRAAFGWALVAAAAARRAIPLSPHEVHQRLRDLAESGDAEPCVAAIAAARRTESIRRAREALAADVRVRVAAAAARPDRRSSRERAADALDSAGATLLGSRRTGQGMLEVTYRFLGERFVTVIEADTLRIVDAGICLQGHDPALTLESLPSAIREAIGAGILHITRW
jgi:hypothetical protein